MEEIVRSAPEHSWFRKVYGRTLQVPLRQARFRRNGPLIILHRLTSYLALLPTDSIMQARHYVLFLVGLCIMPASTFSANYDGNTAVYVVPALGGEPVRVTHHPMTGRIPHWHPDCERLLFASTRESGRQRFNQFYQLSATGGLPEKLPVRYGEFGLLSPDGTVLAYTPPPDRPAPERRTPETRQRTDGS